jgi:hypothetical protein
MAFGHFHHSLLTTPCPAVIVSGPRAGGGFTAESISSQRGYRDRRTAECSSHRVHRPDAFFVVSLTMAWWIVSVGRFIIESYAIVGPER